MVNFKRKMLRNKLFFTNLSIKRTFFVRLLSSFSTERAKIETESFWPKRIRAKYQLIEFFKNNVLFVNQKFIACIKPYDVSNWIQESAKESEDDLTLTVTKILPDLAEEFNREELFLVRSVPRKCSGIIIFASSEEAKDDFSRSVKLAQSWQVPNIKLLCICVGTPNPANGEEELRIDKQLINDQMMHIVGDTVLPTKAAVSKNFSRMFQFRYRTIAKGDDCSLVELYTRSLSWHSHRLFLASKGAPILGDNLYQQRVARVMNKSIIVDPQRASVKNQYIPLDILKCMQISLNEYHRLPIYCFAREIILLKLLTSTNLKQNLKLESPTPDYFRSALKLLFGDIETKMDF